MRMANFHCPHPPNHPWCVAKVALDVLLSSANAVAAIANHISEGGILKVIFAIMDSFARQLYDLRCTVVISPFSGCLFLFFFLREQAGQLSN